MRKYDNQVVLTTEELYAALKAIDALPLKATGSISEVTQDTLYPFTTNEKLEEAEGYYIDFNDKYYLYDEYFHDHYNRASGNCLG